MSGVDANKSVLIFLYIVHENLGYVVGLDNAYYQMVLEFVLYIKYLVYIFVHI
jgi:hypothetical protein